MEHEEDVAPVPSKILALIGIFACSLAAAYLPSASSKLAILRVPGRTFFYAKYFGTGVLLSTAITHLLNSAFRQLGHVRWLGYRHWPGLFVMSSFIGIFLVEYASDAYLLSFHKKCEASDEEALGSGSLKRAPSDPCPSGERSPLLESSPSRREESDNLRRKERILSVSVLQIGIMLHSFVIGLTLAVADGDGFGSLLPAIFFHQLFEGLALGVRLAALKQPPRAHPSRPDTPVSESSSTTTTVFEPTRTERTLPLSLSILFAIPIPLILLISLFVPSLRAAPSSDSSASSVVSSTIELIAQSHRSKADIMQGVTSAISAGLLIYASCIELIAKDFLDNEELQTSPAGVQMGAIVSFVAGAIGMSFI